MKVDLKKIGNLYRSLGDAVAEYPKGACSLSSAEKDAVIMLKSQLENMLAHVREWTCQSKSRSLSAGVSPDWAAEIEEDLYGRN